MSLPWSATLILVAINILWGISFAAAKATVEYLPPLWVIAGKLTIVALLGLPFVKKLPLALPKVIAMTLAHAVGYHILIFTGMSYGLDSATGVLAAQMTVPFTCLLTFIFLKDRLKPNHVIGIGISFIGLMVIFGTPNATNHMNGVLLVVSAALCLAMHNLLVKAWHVTDPLSIIVWECLLAAPIMWAMAFYYQPISFTYITEAPYQVWLGLFYLGAVITLVVHRFAYLMLTKYPAALVVSYSVIAPVAGVICGTLLGEQVTTTTFLGLMVVVSGISLVQKQKRRKVGEVPANA